MCARAHEHTYVCMRPHVCVVMQCHVYNVMWCDVMGWNEMEWNVHMRVCMHLGMHVSMCVLLWLLCMCASHVCILLKIFCIHKTMGEWNVCTCGHTCARESCTYVDVCACVCVVVFCHLYYNSCILLCSPASFLHSLLPRALTVGSLSCYSFWNLFLIPISFL